MGTGLGFAALVVIALLVAAPSTYRADGHVVATVEHAPPVLEIIVMPTATGKPGGAGELGVAASMAAVACAYGRATGTTPTRFPINHGTLPFEPKPATPPVPPVPDGRHRPRLLK